MNKLRLHLGCGNVRVDGFVNVDFRQLPEVDVVDDVRYLNEFSLDSADEIYACHILEHFKRHEFSEVLQRWHEVIKPGGSLYVSVPDFEAISHHYTETGKLEDLMGLLYGGQTYEGNYHYCCWDFQTMKKELENIGFQNVSRYDWKQTEFSSFDDYSKAYIPHMDTSGRLMSLNVKAVKC